MRRNYNLIQRANPHYLSMSVKSYPSSHRNRTDTTETEVNGTPDSANVAPFSYALSTTPFLDDERDADEVNDDLKCSASDLLQFIPEDVSFDV